jgi:hypothetical protein
MQRRLLQKAAGYWIDARSELVDANLMLAAANAPAVAQGI